MYVALHQLSATQCNNPSRMWGPTCSFGKVDDNSIQNIFYASFCHPAICTDCRPHPWLVLVLLPVDHVRRRLRLRHHRSLHHGQEGLQRSRRRSPTTIACRGLNSRNLFLKVVVSCVSPLFFNMQDPKLPGQCGQEDFDKVIRNYRVIKDKFYTMEPILNNE